MCEIIFAFVLLKISNKVLTINQDINRASFILIASFLSKNVEPNSLFASIFCTISAKPKLVYFPKDIPQTISQVFKLIFCETISFPNSESLLKIPNLRISEDIWRLKIFRNSSLGKQHVSCIRFHSSVNSPHLTSLSTNSSINVWKIW